VYVISSIAHSFGCVINPITHSFGCVIDPITHLFGCVMGPITHLFGCVMGPITHSFFECVIGSIILFICPCYNTNNKSNNVKGDFGQEL
jgi:uncharacterized membrane protein YeaQ/YmgE (transglycosylase-associated protein family)